MMDAVKSLKLDLYLLMFVSAEFHRDTPPIVQGPGVHTITAWIQALVKGTSTLYLAR